MHPLLVGELLLKSPVAFTLCAIIVVVAVVASYKGTRFSTRIPRVGKAPGWFGLAEAKRDFISNGRILIDEGYRKVRLLFLY